jgi:hypothetical protein
MGRHADLHGKKGFVRIKRSALIYSFRADPAFFCPKDHMEKGYKNWFEVGNRGG